MRVWGGVVMNRWKEILGPSNDCRLIVKARSKAEALRTMNAAISNEYRRSDFDHFFGESGNNLDLALCDYEGLTVWVRNDDRCLRIYDERRGGKLPC